jgi:hypothetical protein
MLRRRKQNRPGIAQIDVHSRFDLEFMRKLGIHARAGRRKRLEDGRGFEAAVNQHASGGVGGFAAGLSALDYQNGCATLAQCDGEREADDASADNNYVPSLHPGIVKERRQKDLKVASWTPPVGLARFQRRRWG